LSGLRSRARGRRRTLGRTAPDRESVPSCVGGIGDGAELFPSELKHHCPFPSHLGELSHGGRRAEARPRDALPGGRRHARSRGTRS
jgi:hypothetical protein